MGDRRYIVINCNGVLDGTSYIGGTTHAVHMRDEALNFSSLTRIVHKIVQADITIYDYDIFDLIKVNGKIAKCEIHDDRDVEELLGSAHSPKVYVSTKTKISEGLVGNCSSSTARGIVELMEIFNAMKDNRQPHNPSKNIVEEVVDLRSEDHDNVVGSDNDTSIEANDLLNDSDDDSPNLTPGDTNVVASTWSIPGVAIGGGWQALVAYINLACYYIFGLPFGYYLGYVVNLGVMGLWGGMIAGVALQTLLLVLVLYRTN